MNVVAQSASAARPFRTRRWLVPCCAVFALCSFAARAQTVDDIVGKNIQAHGGLDKLKAINSLRITAKFGQGSFRADTLQENKRPDKVREEFIIQGLAGIQAYDGKVGWQVSPFGGRKDPELISREDLKELIVASDLDGPLVDYKSKGHQAELVGHDLVEGTDCFKIKLTLKNGDVRHYYLDTDSFLELKVEIQTTVRGTLQESEMYYGDYEQVNGIYYPFAIEQAEKGSSFRSQISVQKVEQNVSIEDSRFTMPVAKPAAPPPKAGQ